MGDTAQLFGGGQSDRSRQEQGYNSGYSYWQPGKDIDQQGYDLAPSNLSTGFRAGWQGAQDSYDNQMSQAAMWSDFFASMGGGETPDGPSYETQMADQQALYNQQKADAERIQGLNDRDALFSNYMDAAGTATDFINSEIGREQSNAALLGVEYSITDEDKTSRISDYFATLWGEGEQMNLEGLMGKWGDPTGFSGFSVVRGDGGNYAGGETTVSETLSTSQGAKPKVPGQEEDSILGSSATVLGA